MKTLRLFSILFVFCLLAGTFIPARSAPVICTVSKAVDDNTAGTLRNAVDDPGCGIIEFSADFSIYLTDSLSIGRPLTIRGSGHTVTLSGDTGNDGSANVNHFDLGPAAVLSLIELTLVDGYALNYGGSIYINQGDLTVTDIHFYQNHAGIGGGAIYGLEGTLSIINSNFFEDTAGQRAGAVQIDSDIATTITDSVFVANSAHSYGGAIVCTGPLTITRSTFLGNFVEGTTDSRGGAIESHGPLTIDSSTFALNSSGHTGGAIVSSNPQTTDSMSITNSTFYDNSAYEGGAIALLGDSAWWSIVNSTISENTADYLAGGISNDSGGIMTLRNTIIAGNTAGANGDNCLATSGGTIVDGDFNLTWNDDGYCPATFLNGDPKLGPLDDNGGGIATMAPAPGSPAIDGVEDEAVPCPAYDQRGVSRVQGKYCDIGAVEVLIISGTTGVAGVTLGGAPELIVSDLHAFYRIPVPMGWSGTIVPVKAGYTFNPVTIEYENVISSHSAQNYIPTAITYTISGSTGLEGVTLRYFDGSDKSVTSGVGGAYSLTVSYHWTGTVTPSRPGNVFDPPYREYATVSAPSTGQNYLALLPLFLPLLAR